jgi:hypothetical protein
MYSTLQCLLTATFDPHPTAGFFFLLLLLLLLFLLLLFLLLLTLRPAFQLSPLSLYQTSSRPAYLLCFGAFLFVVTESSTGPGKLFKETNVAHVGVHG